MSAPQKRSVELVRAVEQAETNRDFAMVMVMALADLDESTERASLLALAYRNWHDATALLVLLGKARSTK